MPTFGDLQSASRMRDLIERISTRTVERLRPDVRIGKVHHYDAGRQLAWIQYAGEDSSNLVKVRVALNMLPTKTIEANGDACDIVRVAGKPGNYYIADFVRGVPQDPNNIPLVDVNFANQKAINLADATNPQDAVNLRTGDARYAAAAATTAALAGKEPTISAGTTAQYWRGDKTWQTLDKSAVGLSNVDNTSDANKPISTATQTALNLKAPLASPTFTGTVSGITKAMVGLGNVPNVDTSNASNITSGTLPTSVLPPLAINDTFTVASQAAMLALTAQRGDVAVRTDFSPARLFILTADAPATLANWTEMTAAGTVLSVAGKTGAVTLVKGDVGLGNVDNTSDAAKPVSTATQTALNLKADDNLVVKLAGAQAVTGKKTFSTPLEMIRQGSTPSAPAAGDSQIYFKSDGLPYYMGPDGVEWPLVVQDTILHLNPSFETFTDSVHPDGWFTHWRDVASIPATWSRVAGQSDPTAGSYVFHQVIPNGANGRFQTSFIDVLPGQVVTFTIRARCTAGTAPQLGITLLTKAGADPSFFDAGTTQQPTTRNVTVSAGWTKYTVSWVVPDTHTRAAIDVNPFTFSGVSMTWDFDNSTSSAQSTSNAGGVPTGAIMPWISATAPPGYLICNGTVYNISDYPTLGALAGSLFGGNGTTTFATPDLRGRWPIGFNSGATSAAFKTIGGSEPSANLAEREDRMEHRHTHAAGTLANSSQSLNQQTNTTTGGSANRLASPDAHTHTISGSTASAGVASGNTAYHPFMTMYFIIKT